MENISSFSEVANDNWVGSLVFHNSLQRVLRYIKFETISMLTFDGLGFMFDAFWCDGDWFGLSSRSVVISFVSIW